MNHDDLNQAHAAAIRRHWRDMLDLGRPSASLLSDLTSIAERHAAHVSEAREDLAVKEGASMALAARPPNPNDAGPPDGDAIAAWIREHPGEFEAWVAKQARTRGGNVERAPGAPAKPRARARAPREA